MQRRVVAASLVVMAGACTVASLPAPGARQLRFVHKGHEWGSDPHVD